MNACPFCKMPVMPYNEAYCLSAPVCTCKWTGSCTKEIWHEVSKLKNGFTEAELIEVLKKAFAA